MGRIDWVFHRKRAPERTTFPAQKGDSLSWLDPSRLPRSRAFYHVASGAMTRNFSAPRRCPNTGRQPREIGRQACLDATHYEVMIVRCVIRGCAFFLEQNLRARGH